MNSSMTALARRFALLSALACASSAARADVLVVDAAGGGDFTDLPEAVSAAASGDVLIVRTGSYAAFELSGKGLSIVAETGSAVLVQGTLDVHDISGFERVLLAGLEVAADEPIAYAPETNPALVITNSGAQFRLQDCTLRGAPGIIDPYCNFFAGPEYFGGAAAQIVDSGKIAFSNCDLFGGDGTSIGFETFCIDSNGGPGGIALDCDSSQVTVYDSTLLGGVGGEGANFGANGGHGAVSRSGSALFIGSSESTGGDGSTAWDIIAIQDGDGGDGLVIEAGGTAFLADSQLFGGGFRGGTPLAGNGELGVPLDNNGNLVEFTPTLPELTTPNLVRAGQTYAVEARGVPGSSVFLLRSRQPTFVFDPVKSGVRCVASNSTLPHAILGTLSGSGAATYTLAAGDLPRGVEHTTLYLQLIVSTPGVGLVLGTPQTITVVDPSF